MSEKYRPPGKLPPPTPPSRHPTDPLTTEIPPAGIIPGEDIIKKYLKENRNPASNLIGKFVLIDVYNHFYDSNAGTFNFGDTKNDKIGFEKINNTDYLITLDIEAFIMEKDEKFYKFENVSINIPSKVMKGGEILFYQPEISNLNIVHPFIQPDQKIDFQSLNFKSKTGIQFNYLYDLFKTDYCFDTDKKYPVRESTARKISLLLKESVRTIEKGFTTEYFCVPYNSLENCNCLIANNRQDAEKYALNNGIKLEKIINNN